MTDRTEPIPFPWEIERTPNGMGGEFVSIVGPHEPCGHSDCDRQHRPAVAWDIGLPNAQAIMKVVEDLAALEAKHDALLKINANMHLTIVNHRLSVAESERNALRRSTGELKAEIVKLTSLKDLYFSLLPPAVAERVTAGIDLPTQLSLRIGQLEEALREQIKAEPHDRDNHRGGCEVGCERCRLEELLKGKHMRQLNLKAVIDAAIEYADRTREDERKGGFRNTILARAEELNR